MFCPNCGNQIPDGAAFCGFCGANLQQNAPQEQPVAPQPEPGAYQQPEQPAYTQPEQPVYTQPGQPVYNQPQPMYYMPPLTPVQQALKVIGSSPALLITAIGSTIGVLVSLFSTGFNFLAILVGLIVAIPSILMTIGLWMAWASSRTPEPVLKGAGLCRGAAIINAILVGMGIAAVLIGGILIMVVLNGTYSYTTSYYGASREASAILGAGNAAIVVLMLIAAGSLVLSLIYYVKIANSLKAAEDTMRSGFVTGKISGYIMFWNILSIIFAAIGMVSSIVTKGLVTDGVNWLMSQADLYQYYGVITSFVNRWLVSSTLSELVSLVTLICGTIVLSKARRAFTELQQPAYGGQQWR